MTAPDVIPADSTCPRCGLPAPDGLEQPSPFSMVGTVRYHPGCWSNQVAEIRAAIERGERDIAEGRVVSHKEVMRKLRRFRKD